MRAALAAIVIALPALAAAQTNDPLPLVDPGAAELRRAYPREAMERGLGGEVVLGCEVTTAGRLADCEVLIENPTGVGFSEAALALAPAYEYAPARANGELISARTILNVHFSPPPATRLGRFSGPAAAAIIGLLALAGLALFRRRAAIQSKLSEQESRQ